MKRFYTVVAMLLFVVAAIAQGQVLTRENRIAKRNLRLARAGTGGDAARSFLPGLARC